MRNFVLLLIAVLISTFVVPLAILQASAAAVNTAAIQPPQLFVKVGVDPGGRTVFAPATILIPQVNITLNVTFVNNYTGIGEMNHTFSIDNSDNSAREINTGTVTPGKNVSVEFHINSMTNITYKGAKFTPESSGRGIRWYCIPHRGVGMVGEIVLAGLTPATPEKGILIRAYWIGLIGIAATLVWTVISYFIIKSSSRHFSGHREHVRKGLP